MSRINYQRAHEIAARHGCEITSTDGLPAIVVLRQWSQGRPQDDARIAACRAELARAGIDTAGWVS